MRLPSWLMKTSKIKKKVKRTRANKAKVETARPSLEFWVGWPMGEDFNPNILDAAHAQMMQKLGRKA